MEKATTPRLALGLLAAMLVSPAAFAQEKVTLKLADIFPTSHYIVTKGAQVWMDKAVELAGGQLEFQYFPAQQLGKAADILSLTQSGVADIGAVAPAYVPEKLPMTVVGELPGMFDKACAGSYALNKLAQSGGKLDETEYKPHGVRVLFANMLAPYTVMTTKAPIENYKDIAGLKIYASGGAKDVTLSEIGAVPIRLTGPELFQAVQRGTIDGTMLAYIGLPPYDLHTLLRHGMTGVNLGSTAVTYVMSEAKWQQLPEKVQTALMEAGEFASNSLCTHSDTANASEMEALKERGAKIHVIEGGEREELLKLLAPVEEKWASDLEKRGKPAGEVAAAYRAAVEEYEKNN